MLLWPSTPTGSGDAVVKERCSSPGWLCCSVWLVARLLSKALLSLSEGPPKLAADLLASTSALGGCAAPGMLHMDHMFNGRLCRTSCKFNAARVAAIMIAMKHAVAKLITLLIPADVSCTGFLNKINGLRLWQGLACGCETCRLLLLLCRCLDPKLTHACCISSLQQGNGSGLAWCGQHGQVRAISCAKMILHYRHHAVVCSIMQDKQS